MLTQEQITTYIEDLFFYAYQPEHNKEEIKYIIGRLLEYVNHRDWSD